MKRSTVILALIAGVIAFAEGNIHVDLSQFNLQSRALNLITTVLYIFFKNWDPIKSGEERRLRWKLKIPVLEEEGNYSHL